MRTIMANKLHIIELHTMVYQSSQSVRHSDEMETQINKIQMQPMEYQSSQSVRHSGEMDTKIHILQMVPQSCQSVQHSGEMDTKINILFKPIQFIQSTIENDVNIFLNMARFCKSINKTNILSSQKENKVQNGQYNSRLSPHYFDYF